MFPAAKAFSLISRDNNPLHESLPSPHSEALHNICYSLHFSLSLSLCPQGKNIQLMNFPSRCYFCIILLHWFLRSWRAMEKGHDNWPVGLATCNSGVLLLMELMSEGLHLGSLLVKVYCDGYTLQHLNPSASRNIILITPPRARPCNMSMLIFLHPAVIATVYFPCQ